MTSPQYERLDWDSEFFGFPVARIIPPTLDAGTLEAILAELRREGVSLGYWAADGGSAASAAAAQTLGGRLVDRKATYVIDLDTIDPVDPERLRLVEEYTGEHADEGLEALAIQSGEMSRFSVDPGIPRERFEELYRTWIRRSVTGDIANAVLVIHDQDGRLAGMVTVGKKNGRGDIGLIAVDASARGKGYGRLLVAAAMEYSRRQGHRTAQVVTQGDNRPACRLYEAAGYRLEQCQDFFHFWLD